VLTIRAMTGGEGYAQRHLQQSNYYDQNRTVEGKWHGRGAELLGLKGEVTSGEFEAVRQGLDPQTGEFFRQRHGADRIASNGEEQSKARSLYDMTFSAPKSVSVMAIVGGDERLVAAHETAVREALEQAEKYSATRVRLAGLNENRTTGNWIVASYTHDTSRQLDPQLHTHAVAANLTYDGTEGRWKALQYYSRRFYNDLLISPHAENDMLQVYVVSDRLKATQAEIRVSLMDFDGKSINSTEKTTTIPPLNSTAYLSIPMKEWLNDKDKKNLMVYCELVVGGKTVSSNEYFFEPFKDLALSKPSISFDVLPIRGGCKVVLESDKFAKAVYLSVGSQAGFFKDNYLDLVPGKKAEVTFKTSEKFSPTEFRNQLKIRSMSDSF